MRLFTEREVKIIAIVVGAATLLAVVITISVSFAGRPRTQNIGDGGQTTPDSTDFIVPEEFTLTGGERWNFSREPFRRWTDEQVRRYWIDPAGIGINLMEKKTDTAIEELFLSLP